LIRPANITGNQKWAGRKRSRSSLSAPTNRAIAHLAMQGCGDRRRGGRHLRAAGYSVFREYYVNNVGNQMNTLGKSVLLRCRELLGEEIEFRRVLQGDYIRDLAGNCWLFKAKGWSTTRLPSRSARVCGGS